MAWSGARVATGAPASQPQISRCTASQLATRVSGTAVGLGNVAAYLRFTNTSARACTLSGWPQVTGVRANGETTTARDVRSGYFGPLPVPNHVPVVRLARRSYAEAVITGGDNPLGNARSCGAYRRFAVRAPGADVRVTLSAWNAALTRYFPTCAGLAVTMVVPRRDLIRG